MCMFAYLQLNGTLIKAINSVIQYFNITYFPNNPILKQMIQKLHETADYVHDNAHVDRSVIQR